MDDTRIWFYAVMIFIAFVSWLRKRIQAVREARVERGSSRQNQSQEEDRRRQESSQSSSDQEAPASRTPNSLKELFQLVADEQARAQDSLQQPPQISEVEAAPPPLPVSREEVKFHQSEAAFHQSDSATTVHERTVPLGSSPPRKSRRPSSNRTRRAIAGAFSDRGKIRDAFILKEILDTPKGMQ